MGLKCILQGQELQPSDTLPKSPGTAAIGSSTLYARADHVHPQDDTKLDKSGGTMTGSLVLNSDPAESLEAATKQYVDNHSGGDGSKIGDIKITARTDLGDNWLLCNGYPFSSTEYKELSQVLSFTIEQDSWKNWRSLDTIDGYCYWNKTLTNCLVMIKVPTSAIDGKYNCQVIITNSNGVPIINKNVSSSNAYSSIALYENFLYLGYLSNKQRMFDCYDISVEDWGNPISYSATAINSFSTIVHIISSTGQHIIAGGDGTNLTLYYGDDLSNLTTGTSLATTKLYFGRNYYIDSNYNIWWQATLSGYYSITYYFINTSALTLKQINTFSNYEHYSFIEYDGNMILSYVYYNDSSSAYYYSASLTDGTKKSSGTYNSNSSYGDVYLFKGLYWSIRNSYTSYEPTRYTYYIKSYNSPTTTSYLTSTSLTRYTSNDYESYYTVFPYEKIGTFISFNNFVFGLNGYILTDQPRLPLISQDASYAYIKAKEETT